MEEGPEAQELFEQAEKSHEIAEDHDEHAAAREAARKTFIMQSAITASVLAVGAALVSLLSGHAANDAIVDSIHAADEWNYYQAKSTKEHIFQANRELLLSLGEQKVGLTEHGKQSLATFETKLRQYEKEKDDIQRHAEDLNKESLLQFDKHQKFSLGVACFQIGIVLASVSILTVSRILYFEAVGAGLIGIAFTVWGVLLK